MKLSTGYFVWLAVNDVKASAVALKVENNESNGDLFLHTHARTYVAGAYGDNHTSV